ncbi:MAG: class I SAM-dependent methyltransferase [Gammaproteobacteria bacterium]
MSEQTWNPAEYARHAGFVAAMGVGLIDLLAPVAGESILDLGCGDGALTVKLLPHGVSVTAVDSSAEQVAAARALGLDASVADAQSLAYDGVFDGVLSNAALHWMKRPEAVIDGVWRALRPGGRFVGEMGASGNVGTVVAAAEAVLRERGVDAAAFNPWFFPTAEEYAALLAARGFEVSYLDTFERPTPQEGDIVHWLRIFMQAFAAAVPAAERDAFYDAVAARVRPRLQRPDGSWFVDYVRLRFRADRPRAEVTA